ncbi:hypothetical protein Tco_1092514 [Tanacetum coccineum]|uniref:Reverse transcriptase domain-containing protein n=1 Tax=Tanacetum coccineum TaxID=301880 RepID=A0ABQ5IA56_9ASTR
MSPHPMRDKNYNQLLPILAEKMHQEKVKQEKLKAVKARLNFEETSQHSESGATSRRRDVRKRLGPKDARSMSRSPEPKRARSPRRKDPEKETVFRRLEKGVFHRLGDKEKGMSAYSGSSRRQSYHSSRGDTESYYQSSRSRGTEPAPKRHQRPHKTGTIPLRKRVWEEDALCYGKFKIGIKYDATDVRLQVGCQVMNKFVYELPAEIPWMRADHYVNFLATPLRRCRPGCLKFVCKTLVKGEET